MKLNLANKLTLFRIILVPILMLIPIIEKLFGINGTFLGISTSFWIMNIIFIIASITDKLDGYIARSRNEVTTFGKGVIQEVIEFSDGSALKVTVQEYYTPNKNKIHEVGVSPDIVVELSKDEDTQLNKAIEILK